TRPGLHGAAQMQACSFGCLQWRRAASLLSVVTITELRRGIERLASGRRRDLPRAASRRWEDAILWASIDGILHSPGCPETRHQQADGIVHVGTPTRRFSTNSV